MICSAFVLSSSTVYSTCLQSQDLSEAKVNQYTSKTDFFFLGLCNVAMCVGCTIYCIQYISDGWSLPCRRCAPPLRPGMYVWSKSTWYQVESRNAPFRLAEARRTDALSLVSPAKLRPCPLQGYMCIQEEGGPEEDRHPHPRRPEKWCYSDPNAMDVNPDTVSSAVMVNHVSFLCQGNHTWS